MLGGAPAAARAPVQPQEEMNIDFDDDESPRQVQQRLNRTATPQNAAVPVTPISSTFALLCSWAACQPLTMTANMERGLPHPPYIVDSTD